MDLQKFKRCASRKKKILSQFLQKLDTVVPEGFSKLVKEEDAKVWQETDCTTCANCCKTMTPTYTKADVKRIAAHFEMTEKVFFEKYLTRDEDTDDVINKQIPCPFLKDDKCSIYAIRPKDCADFPHHFRRPFDVYNETYLQNLGRCPATFRLVERLEKRVREEYEF